MSAGFKDSPNKRTVRKDWDTPILNHYFAKWKSPFFYLGLPGSEALDVKQWNNMIGRVVAFEEESEEAANPRKDIIALEQNIALLKIRSSVYSGSFEEVVLKGRDLEGKKYIQDEFVTLYNLDFCNSITGRITIAGRKQCLRFDALRMLISRQVYLVQRTQKRNFLIFLTTHDEIHTGELTKYLKRQMPEPVRSFNEAAAGAVKVVDAEIQTHTMLTKSFVHNMLDTYLSGTGISSYFYPMVRYIGASTKSPMLHFSILCSFMSQETAYPLELQKAEDFLRSTSYTAADGRLISTPLSPLETQNLDPSIHPTI